MQIFTNFKREDTAHVTIQLSNEQYASLRLWMHTPEGQMVEFLHGVRLLKRGFGWYRMEASKPFRAIDKLKTSMAVVMKWSRDFELKRRQELIVLGAQVQGAKVMGFDSEKHEYTLKTADGKTRIIGLHQDRVLVPTAVGTAQLADASKLAALANRFGGARR